jgi:hypothetical protein
MAIRIRVYPQYGSFGSYGGFGSFGSYGTRRSRQARREQAMMERQERLMFRQQQLQMRQQVQASRIASISSQYATPTPFGHGAAFGAYGGYGAYLPSAFGYQQFATPFATTAYGFGAAPYLGAGLVQQSYAYC